MSLFQIAFDVLYQPIETSQNAPKCPFVFGALHFCDCLQIFLSWESSAILDEMAEVMKTVINQYWFSYVKFQIIIDDTQ